MQTDGHWISAIYTDSISNERVAHRLRSSDRYFWIFRSFGVDDCGQQ